MLKARQILNQEHDNMEKRLASFIEGRRLAKVILRHLRNQPLSYVSLSYTNWEGASVTHTCYIYLSRVVKSFRDLSPLLTRLDNLPMQSKPDWIKDDNGWTVADDEREGVRRYTREFYRRGVRFTITLTAIPEEKEGTCRKVQVGTKTETIHTTTPVYELICD